MKIGKYLVAFSALALALPAAAQTRDSLVPAGTLLQCTMNEPDFSSATVSVGDPFLCYPRSIQQFGQTVFPRGTYMVGHLESSKEPGRLVGKGYLQLSIDRIGLPSTDLPLSAKVISVAGYKVERNGEIDGKGHAERDVLEWMFPPLWPWKLVTLPARGPRPDLKGEIRITLRVLDDFSVPQIASNAPAATRYSLPLPPPPSALPSKPNPGWHYFGQPGALMTTPQRPAAQTVEFRASAPTPATTPTFDASAWPANVTLFVTTDGALVPVASYTRDHDQLNFTLADNAGDGSLALRDIDWGATTRVNVSRGVRVTLREAATSQP